MSRESFGPNDEGLDASTTWDALPGDNDYIAGLTWGVKWGFGDPDDGITTELDYYLYDVNNTSLGSLLESKVRTLSGYESSPWNSDEVDTIKKAMKAYSDVANIIFTQTNQIDKANILWANAPDLGSGSLGIAQPPDLEYSKNPDPPQFPDGLYMGDIFINSSDAISIEPGSYGYLTFPHELGHAVGLKHPHNIVNGYPRFPGVAADEAGEADGGYANLNSTPWLVMTYNDVTASNGLSSKQRISSGYLTTLGAFDIATAQYLYGPNRDANTEDNVYILSDQLNGYQCIWDNGGEDTIKADSSTRQGVEIDLRNATLKDKEGGGGFTSVFSPSSPFSSYDFKGYTIAYNSTGECIIENAIGGTEDDVLTGNSSSNKLEGGGGDDVLTGGEGVDQLWGGSGMDTFKITEGAGHDVVNDFVVGVDRIYNAQELSVNILSFGEDAQLFHGDDLLAVIKGGVGELTQSGFYIS